MRRSIRSFVFVRTGHRIGPMADVLLVAATEIELCERPGLACGVGPVEAAAATARAIASDAPSAVVHIGIAGGRGITPGGLVIGSESLYIDLSAEIPIVDVVHPDPDLLARVREGAPDALVLPIGTSGAVGGVTEDRLRVEAMEGFGVLRACELAGVPAVEIRAISNELGEGDRSRWRIGRALESLADALPGLLEAAAK
jgi:futalosine hydrolase